MGDLEEDVYMKPPPGLLVPSKNLVCKLNKSIYGIKQDSRQWNKKLTLSLINLDFCQSKVDYSLFTKKYNSSFTAILVYVDDLLLTCNNLHEINHIKFVLDNTFFY